MQADEYNGGMVLGLRKPATPEQIVLVDEPENQEPSSEFSLIRLEIPSVSPSSQPSEPSPISAPASSDDEATMVLSNSAPMAEAVSADQAASVDAPVEIALSMDDPVEIPSEPEAGPSGLSDALQAVLAQEAGAPQKIDFSSFEPAAEPPSVQRDWNAGALPVGDALVPGGAHRSPDLDTLKHYLLLREQDVAALSHQLQAAQSQLASLHSAMHAEQERAADLEVRLQQALNRLNQIDLEYGQKLDSKARDLEHAQLDSKAKIDQLRAMESRLQSALLDVDQARERIKRETMHVRSREKELENRLDLLKHDSDAMLLAREQRIVELKRKLDTLEFNFALLQEQYDVRKRELAQANDRLGQVVQAMKLAEGLAASK